MESHYVVVFSFDNSCVQDPQLPFDVYYYDQLGNAGELYRLTLSAKRANYVY